MAEFFDLVNCEENKVSLDKFLLLIIDGNAVLFIGSGSSRQLEYPSWNELQKRLNNLVIEDSDRKLIEEKINNNELLVAAHVKNQFKYE